MAFGEKLQEVRKQSGMTQETFAEQLHVSRQAVSRWESGRGYPEIEKILYSGHGTTDGSYLKQYVDQCLAGIDTGKYLYLAHPDLFLFNGDEAVFDREYRRLCREVKKRNIPLEINFLGLMEERWYPNKKFWKIAGEEGNTAVFGCDAHTPKVVWNPETEQKALQLAAKYGLKVQETVPMPKTF